MALVQYPQITGDGLGNAPRPPLRLGEVSLYLEHLIAQKHTVSRAANPRCVPGDPHVVYTQENAGVRNRLRDRGDRLWRR